jgi:hypothetical protein
MQTYQQPSEG